MRWFFFAVSILSCFTSSSSQVVLNEVYYDHVGRDEGFEFVELINVSGDCLGLDGCRLDFHDGASSGWVTIWEAQPDDTIGGAGGLFVIGGDSIAQWCDVIVDLGLQNGPDAVRLANRDGVLDLLGYGSLDDPAFFEKRCAPDVASGLSLSRMPDGNDTDDNATDFAATEPSPGRFNIPHADIAIRLGTGTPARAVRSGLTSESLWFRVINNGLNAVGAGGAVVQLEDSTQHGVRHLGSASVDADIAPGDSLEVDFTVGLVRGYHFLTADVAYAADERPENNAVKIYRRVGPAPLMVSEIMSHPRSGCPEYIELFNPGGEPYDLIRHRLRDAAHDPVEIVSVSVWVQPRDFVVLTSEAAALCECFPGIPVPVIEVEGAWPSLNHTGSGGVADSIVVLDGHLLSLVRLGYPPQPSDTSGRSLERVDLYSPTGPAVWVLSRDPRGGSPGVQHSEVILERPDGPAVRASPNPFDPWESETLFLTIPEQNESAKVIVGIFDLRGRRIRDLAVASRLPSVMAWDGTDGSGRVVDAGFYVVACEFVSLVGGGRRVEKVVVGCARRTER